LEYYCLLAGSHYIRRTINVVFASVLSYFLLVAFAVAIAVFPDFRGRLFGYLTSMATRSADYVGTGGSHAWGHVARLFTLFRGGVNNACRYVRDRPRLTLAALLAVALPSLVAYSVRQPYVSNFSDTTGTDSQIAVLLNGEQLVPPPPLPPEAFTTREVEQLRPDIARASRNWSQLEPEFVQRLLVVFKLMKERHGYDMVLLEGYRTPERQAELFAQGAQVTQAAANMSYHQYGLAADLAFMRDGKVVISERDPWAMKGYQLYGEVAEQVGLTWGGRWKMLDYGHVELRKSGVLGSQAQPRQDQHVIEEKHGKTIHSVG